MKPTVEQAKSLQHLLFLRDTHVVWVGDDGFSIAHTDMEREAGGELEECSFHLWMERREVRPVDPGWYSATSVSQAQAGDAWLFTPIGQLPGAHSRLCYGSWT